MIDYTSYTHTNLVWNSLTIILTKIQVIANIRQLCRPPTKTSRSPSNGDTWNRYFSDPNFDFFSLCCCFRIEKAMILLKFLLFFVCFRGTWYISQVVLRTEKRLRTSKVTRAVVLKADIEEAIMTFQVSQSSERYHLVQWRYPDHNYNKITTK